MRWRGVEICCPVCKGDLTRRQEADGSEVLACGACPGRYPVVLDIPDLRIFPDPFIELEADRAKARRIAERYPSSSFEELVDFYYSITPEVPATDRERFKRSLLTATARGAAALDAWEHRARSQGPDPGADLLEIGCGTGGLLVAAAPRYRSAVGIDLAFRWLVIGRKRLEEAGVDAVTICACAEALPFPAAGFDRVVADSALEHLRDQPRALAEAARVLRAGGRLFATTPNRHSLGPDPHTGLLMGSWLPDRWTAAYMVRRGARPPVRQLLARTRLAALLRGAGFTDLRMFPPGVSEALVHRMSGLTRMLAAGYRVATRLPLLRTLLLLIGPLLSVTAIKRSD